MGCNLARFGPTNTMALGRDNFSYSNLFSQQTITTADKFSTDNTQSDIYQQQYTLLKLLQLCTIILYVSIDGVYKHCHQLPISISHTKFEILAVKCSALGKRGDGWLPQWRQFLQLLTVLVEHAGYIWTSNDVHICYTLYNLANMDMAVTLVNTIWDLLHMLMILYSYLQLYHHSANNLYYVTIFHMNLTLILMPLKVN